MQVLQLHFEIGLDLALADCMPSTSHQMNPITLLVLCYNLEHTHTKHLPETRASHKIPSFVFKLTLKPI